MADPGTEKRIDELSKRVDFGFEQTNQRLTRIEDDVRALRTEVKDGFDAVNTRFDAVNARFDAVNARFDGVNGSVNARFDSVAGEFTAVRGEMKAGFDAVNVRFDRLQHLMIGFFASTLVTIVAAVIVNLILSHS